MNANILQTWLRRRIETGDENKAFFPTNKASGFDWELLVDVHERSEYLTAPDGLQNTGPRLCTFIRPQISPSVFSLLHVFHLSFSALVRACPLHELDFLRQI